MGPIVGDAMAGSGTARTAFETLFRAEAARLVRLAQLLGADDPEDVVQEAFCRLYDATRRRPPTNPTAYLNRIVVNEVRTRGRRKILARRKVLHGVAAAPADEHVVLTESVRSLLRALDNLAPRQREALVLRYWLDLPLAEIADVMLVRVGTVKSLISRGLARLAAKLEDHR
jgi:RNA polymerase sigma factor (sigma-70 family)